MSTPKDPRLVEAGKRGAARRWGPHGRIVRLDQLTEAEREYVVAALELKRSREAAASETPAAAPDRAAA